MTLLRVLDGTADGHSGEVRAESEILGGQPAAGVVVVRGGRATICSAGPATGASPVEYAAPVTGAATHGRASSPGGG